MPCVGLETSAENGLPKQGKHAEVASVVDPHGAKYVPVGQEEAHVAAPAAETVEAEHGMQKLAEVAPASADAVPAGQGVQPLVAPLAYVPAGHVATQTVAPAADALAAAHAAQLELPVPDA
jgi:hypothetical protein